jgi:glycosyltransferase involved in cell wall biosynthesis
VTRVLLIHQPVDGGVGRHVRDVANGLDARGYDVVLCGPSPVQGTIRGVTHRRLDMQRAVGPRADLSAVASLTRIIKELRPDLVHAHSSKAGGVARLARPACPRLPIVYSPHLYAFARHFERSAERSLYRTLERLLAPAATRVVCVCEAEARLARAIGPARRVRVVYNGIEPIADRPPDERIAALRAEGPVIGTLTLLHQRKGVQTLIDATPTVLARHPSAQVAIVGEGPELEALRAQARGRKVAHAVSFLGLSTDPPAALRAMDVFAHPSLAESFPYVVLEAMAAGRPIVATAVGGVPEAVSDGEDGLLVAPRDADALAHAICELLEEPTRAASMGRAAQRKAQERFTLAHMIDGLCEVYDEALGARTSTAHTASSRTG